MADPRTAIRLIEITLENFRGVRRKCSFRLDAQVVLFVGPNGTGKTSVFDAFVWLMLDDIPRLKPHALRKSDDYVVNSYDPESPASVSLIFEASGRRFIATRTGNRTRSSLTVRALEAQAEVASLQLLVGSSQLPFDELLRTSGLLQQDDLRSMLRDRPADRYRQLVRLLGLDVLQRFDAKTKSWHQATKAATADAARAAEVERGRLAELESRLDASQSILEQRANPIDLAELQEAISSAAGVVKIEPELVDDPARIAADAGALVNEIDSFLTTAEETRAEVLTAPDELSIAALEAALVTAQTALVDLAGQAQAARATMAAIEHSHGLLGSLAQVAIPLLESSPSSADGLHECPVCMTKVDAASVAAHLSERASGSAELSTAIQALEAIRALQQVAEKSAREAQERVDEARRLARAASEVERAQASLVARARAFASLDALALPRVRAVLDREMARAGARSTDILMAVLPEVHAARPYLDSIELVATHLNRRVQAALSVSSQASEIPRLVASIESSRVSLAEKTQTTERRQSAESEASELSRQSAIAIQNIVAERFSAVEPLLNDIYGRLDPHPTFKKLGFVIEPYWAKGTATATVFDETTAVSANPLLIFSAAQANIVVLSAFLALGWAAPSGSLAFVLMDDPLQSLDDVNVLGFADLLRQIRTRKQVILSTHEERFARLIERKLASGGSPYSLTVHRFRGWDRNGPVRDDIVEDSEAEVQDRPA